RRDPDPDRRATHPGDRDSPIAPDADATQYNQGSQPTPVPQRRQPRLLLLRDRKETTASSCAATLDELTVRASDRTPDLQRRRRNVSARLVDREFQRVRREPRQGSNERDRVSRVLFVP